MLPVLNTTLNKYYSILLYFIIFLSIPFHSIFSQLMNMQMIFFFVEDRYPFI